MTFCWLPPLKLRMDSSGESGFTFSFSIQLSASDLSLARAMVKKRRRSDASSATLMFSHTVAVGKTADSRRVAGTKAIPRSLARTG